MWTTNHVFLWIHYIIDTFDIFVGTIDHMQIRFEICVNPDLTCKYNLPRVSYFVETHQVPHRRIVKFYHSPNCLFVPLLN